MKPGFKQRLGHIIEKATTGKTQVDCLSPTMLMKYLVQIIILKVESYWCEFIRTGCRGPVELSRDDWEARRVRRELSVGSTSDDGGNSLYQPMTMLERSSSSSKILSPFHEAFVVHSAIVPRQSPVETESAVNLSSSPSLAKS